MAEDAKFVQHIPCESCGSSDANSLYDDGHQFCFACEAYVPPNTAGDGKPPASQAKPKSTDFIEGTYLPVKSRSLNVEVCKKYGYEVAKVGGRPIHIANYRDAGGAKIAQHIRYADTKDFFWIGDAKNAAFFGQHLFGGGKRLVITEGEIDCLSIAQAMSGWPVVSLPSGITRAPKDIQRHLEWIERFQEVVLAFDDDEPGREGVKLCAPLISPGKCKVMRYLGRKDANELLSQTTPKDVVNCIFNAETYRPDGIISFGDLRGRILKRPEMGLATPFPLLNEMIHGLRPRELVLFTAGSGIGKSTLVHEIGYDLRMRHGQNLGIMALEENPERLAWRYQSIHLNCPIHLKWDAVSDEDKMSAFEALRPDDGLYLYEHFGSQDVDNLISKLRYMAVGLRCQWIIIDHISIVVSGLDEIGESERKTIDKLMTRLRSLIEETGCGVLAVVHLKRPSKGRSYNNGREIALTDLRGSGGLEQLSDTVVGMERDQQAEEYANFAGIRVLKCRYTGRTGKADFLEYNPDTGRLLEANAKAEGFAAAGHSDGGFENDDF